MRGSFLLLLFAAACLAGCGATFPAGWASTREELVAARYPAEPDRGEPLDVEVIREGGSLYLVNREPRRFDGARLWLNQQWAGELKRVPIGSGNWVSLDLFVNRHGEGFPRGLFLRPDLEKPLILAELVPAGSSALRPLTVVPGE